VLIHLVGIRAIRAARRLVSRWVSKARVFRWLCIGTQADLTKRGLLVAVDSE